jgi:hypothetical protein
MEELKTRPNAQGDIDPRETGESAEPFLWLLPAGPKQSVHKSPSLDQFKDEIEREK